MADWVWVESPGSGLNEKPRVRAAQFGDGYEQRAPDGINAMPQEWDYSADDVDDAVATDMIAFLRAHKGTLHFGYVPLWETVSIRVVCQEWTRTLGSRIGTSSIRAKFRQVFEP